MQGKHWYFVTTPNHKSEIIFGDYPKVDGITYDSCSARYESKEQLLEDCGIPTDPCKHCGQLFKTSYVEECKKRLIEKHLCFTCDFWFEKAEKQHEKNRFVVNGTMYKVEPDLSKDYQGFKGFGGHEFKFQKPNGEIVVSHNVWSNGKMPESFRKLIPDNAIILK